MPAEAVAPGAEPERRDSDPGQPLPQTKSPWADRIKVWEEVIVAELLTFLEPRRTT